jgi:dihydrofolate reductase
MIVTLIAAITADGKIAQATGQSSLDWTSKEDTRFFVEKTKEIGAVVMGRKTFETIGKPLKERRLIVMSGSHVVSPPAKGEAGGGGTVEWTTDSPADLVARLDREGVPGLAICGGAAIYAQFLQAGLVDELFLTVEPVLFGDGISLATGVGRIDMRLVEVRPMGERAVLLHYVIEN